MSTEHHDESHSGEPLKHTDVSFESADIDTRTILAYLFYLALAVIAAFAISVLVFRFTTKIAVDSETLPAPVLDEHVMAQAVDVMYDYITELQPMLLRFIEEAG